MNFVNKEYEQLQEKLYEFIEKWANKLKNEGLTKSEEVEAISEFPVIPQLSLTVNIEQYRRILSELFSLLKDHQNKLSADLQKLEKSLTDENCKQWFKEVIVVNEYYFTQYAKEYEVSDWLPFFVAENGVRPFLQKITAEIAPLLKEAKSYKGCPACGEPARLAIINKEGKKEVICPRCSWAWQDKKIKCAHCGNEEPGNMEILKAEKDGKAEIHVCQSCKGYTKVIDTRNLIRKEPPALMDINTIHLDYIAQENGYGIPEDSTGAH